jgi:hypothetical protein
MSKQEKPEEKISEAKQTDEPAAARGEPMEKAFRERLRSVKSVTERRTLGGLARELGGLPGEAATRRRRAASQWKRLSANVCARSRA